jgi:hypothetical protein
MDFCRSVEVKGLACGTWDIAMIHQSAGALGSQGWKLNSKIYFEKWGVVTLVVSVLNIEQFIFEIHGKYFLD